MLKYHATRQRLAQTPGGGLPFLLYNAQRLGGSQGIKVLKLVNEQNRLLSYAHVSTIHSRDAEIIMNLLISAAYAQYQHVEWTVMPEWRNYVFSKGICLHINETLNNSGWPTCNETWFLKETHATGDQ